MYIPPLTPAQAMQGQKSTVPWCAGSWLRFAFSVYRLRNFFAGELGTLVSLLEKKQMDKTLTTNVKIQTVSNHYRCAACYPYQFLPYFSQTVPCCASGTNQEERVKMPKRNVKKDYT